MQSIIGSTFARTPISIWHLKSDGAALRRDGMNAPVIASAQAVRLSERMLLTYRFSMHRAP